MRHQATTAVHFCCSASLQRVWSHLGMPAYSYEAAASVVSTHGSHAPPKPALQHSHEALHGAEADKQLPGSSRRPMLGDHTCSMFYYLYAPSERPYRLIWNERKPSRNTICVWLLSSTLKLRSVRLHQASG